MVQTGSMKKYTKGNLLLINDKPLNYAMSNIFEIGATWPKAYDRVVIGKNGPYVLACFRAEGEDKTWWSMPRSEERRVGKECRSSWTTVHARRKGARCPTVYTARLVLNGPEP